MLHNAGLSKLYDLSVTSSDNHFTNISLPDTLYPGDSGLLTIRFTPTTAGLKQAVITIASNGGTLKLSATGSGVEPPVMTLSGVPVQIVAKADWVDDEPVCWVPDPLASAVWPPALFRSSGMEAVSSSGSWILGPEELASALCRLFCIAICNNAAKTRWSFQAAKRIFACWRPYWAQSISATASF